MKHLISFIIIFCLLLSGCSFTNERIKEPVTFYYISESYQQDMEKVVVSEIREASGHREDLSYLLALYSMGPSTKDLKSPLPRNTRIVPEATTDNSIVLHLSDNALTISDADFTLAGACIAMTCMELTGIEQVTVVCGDRDMTIQEGSLLLDTSSTQKTQEDTK